LVIGGGQAGLAMSRCLAAQSIEHVVLERGRVAERWRSERWDSLRLLTPNWQSRLPGFSYDGPDPDGYMTMPEVIDYLERYARAIAAPVETGTTVQAVRRTPGGFLVTTDRGEWVAPTVVIATGYCDLPHVPRMARNLAADVEQIVPGAYRRPSELRAGGVLIVGASASGVQLADELRRSGRPVTLAVGHHTRVPRWYQGRDILWWLDRMGIFGESVDAVYDVEISRNQPSLQLVGRPDHSTLDLLSLKWAGVQIAGRLRALDGTRVFFADDLVATTAAADAKLASLLVRIDGFAAHEGLQSPIAPGEAFEPHWPTFTDAPVELDLRAAGITTVVWATGFRREYPWLQVPVVDEHGEIGHHGGVTGVPGLYVIGLPFLRTRKSAFIDGVGDDAAAIAEHIVSHRPISSASSALLLRRRGAAA
jgi:putative flavoprotein involved in K+ transport